MTPAQFRAELHAEIDRHWRRIERLKARLEGRADIKLVHVEAQRIAFTRRAHTRAMITVTSGRGSKQVKR